MNTEADQPHIHGHDVSKAKSKELAPDSLAQAFDDARGRGPGWAKRTAAGKDAMHRLLGALGEEKA
jgi:hypothetical protein